MNKTNDLPPSQFEPLAIIGMGCRFPGDADSPSALWSLLVAGTDAITEIPPARRASWPEAALKLISPWGGFLREVDKFDAEFFRIAPREADYVDPQQRLLLEVSWEALENAGLAPATLAGSETGVFVALCSHDYERLQAQNEGSPSAYLGTGTAAATASGRLAYFYDFRGPALSIDTASSASLAAFHLACRSLHCGETSLALAAGVNLLLTPELSIGFTKAGMLSPDGRSRGFDQRANGYVRGEGCGVVVLKRLTDALTAGHRILAVVRGSAMNQDGASMGLTVPSRAAQEDVIRKALRSARLGATEVSYVEAHGSGTAVGDPIEGKALQSVYGGARPAALIVGSVKSNIGHLEAAAGIAGLMKTVLALENRYIPAHLHFQRLPPALAGWPMEIPTAGRPWPSPDGVPRRAGVSSFGFSGTNVHVLLEEAPPIAPRREIAECSHQTLLLSAQSAPALRALASRYATFLAQNPAAPWADSCFTTQTGRAQLTHRLAAIAESGAEAREQLLAFIQGQPISGIKQGEIRSPGQPRLAFLYTGGGAQYLGMGQRLYAVSQTFRTALDRCDALLRPLREHSLLEVLFSADTATTRLHELSYLQPALFAISYALTQLWQAFGIRPDVVLGHSTGEYAAACAAGVLSLEDAITLVAKRSQLMQNTAPGEMIALRTSEARLTALLPAWRERISLAVINGPSSVVIAGDGESLRGLLAELPDVEATRLQVSCASHSPLMDEILDEFESAARQVAFSPPRLGFVSTLLGKSADHELTTPEYWRRHIREPVRFADGIQALHNEGAEIFIEMGPRPTLLGLGRQVLEGQGVWLPSLQPPRAEWEVLQSSLAELYVRGFAVDWSAVAREEATPRQPVELPTYAFSRQRYWLPASSGRRWTAQAAEAEAPTRRADQSTTAARPPALRTQLGQATELRRRELVTEFVATWVRQVLRLAATQLLPADRPLRELGLDSLMAGELASALDKELGVVIPTQRIISGGSIQSLTAILIDKVVLQPGSEPARPRALPPIVAPTEPAPEAPMNFHDAAKDVPQIHAIVTEQQQRKVRIDGRWVLDFASCNYLGLDLHPDVIAAVLPALQKWGVHPSWTRAVASPEIYEELEAELANFLKAPTALVFPSVTLLHAGVMPVLTGYDGIIFRDILAHRSIYESCIQAQAQGVKVFEFKHNDPVDLESKLACHPRAATKIIAIDGVYSMSGLYAPLPIFARLAREYNATVYLDDAHGLGVIGENPSPTMPYGQKGNGIVNHFGLDYVADRMIYVAALSKSFSSYGAVITCHDEAMKQRFRSASTFIFSGPSPVASLASALAGLRINRREGEPWRAQIYRLVYKLVNEAKAMGFEVVNDNYFPIVGVMIGSTPDVVTACKILWEFGILITPALFPIVPIGRGLLRFSITAANTEEEIDRSLAALAAVRQKLSAPTPA